MSRPATRSKIAHRIRGAGLRYLLGRESQTATSTHWKTQWLPPHTILEIQWKQICELVAYARDASPFYRDRLQSRKIGPGFTLEAFQRIPPLRRGEVVSSWRSICPIAPRAPLLRRNTGGSSGEHVQIPIDRATYCWYMAGTWRGLRWWGSDFSERGVIMLGGAGEGLRSLAVRAKDWVMNWLRVPAGDQLDRNAPSVLDRIAAFGPAYIYGYPSAVHLMARAVKAHGWRPHGRLKVIVLTGEPVYAFQRRFIEETFQCPVSEEYGNAELGCMAFECPERMLHVTAENVFLETEGVEPPLDGAGRILATQLHNRLFPLIRYETGDVGILAPDSCRCERGLPTVRVLTRVHERLEGRQGAMWARPMAEALFDALPERLQGRVRIVHTTPECVELQVERGQLAPADLAHAADIGGAVFSNGWRVDAVWIERLPRLSSGKLPYFLHPETR